MDTYKDRSKSHVLMSGHGSIDLLKEHIQVPRGCSIHFYTDFAKLLVTTDEYKIIDRLFTDSAVIPVRTVNEFMMVPNFRLYSQDDSWTKRTKKHLKKNDNAKGVSVRIKTTSGAKSLSTYFNYLRKNDKSRELHWFACQEATGLKPVGGESKGFNAVHRIDGTYTFEEYEPATDKIWVITCGSDGTETNRVEKTT